MPQIPRADAESLIRLISSNILRNKELSSICQLNGLQTSGVKATLQNRIVTLIHDSISRDDITRFRQIESSVASMRSNGESSRLPPGKPSYNPPPPSATHQRYYGGSQPGQYAGGANGYRGGHQLSISFKSTPFYEIKSPIGSVRTCEIMNQHRNVVSMKVRVSDYPILQQCLTDKSMRVMVFCAGDKHGVQDIAFPHQSEVKVNGGEIKANLRGLKNKPGSTRPVDITDELRLKVSTYENKVELLYALTTKAFYVGIYLCKTTSVPELVAKIQAGKRIPKASVVQEITRKAADPDIVTTSQKLSLKCPLSYMRLEVPCRSPLCSHIQCFDATSYLQLQEQGPQWLCPICNKLTLFEGLAVDEYVKDILANTSRDQDQVSIEPDAQWRVQSQSSPHRNSSAPRSAPSAALEDDDEVEASELSIVGGRRLETPTRSAQSTATPATTAPSRDSPAVSRGLGSVSGKRPAASHDVVDLTLSSDEEDRPPPTKKQQVAPPGGPLRLHYP